MKKEIAHTSRGITGYRDGPNHVVFQGSISSCYVPHATDRTEPADLINGLTTWRVPAWIVALVVACDRVTASQLRTMAGPRGRDARLDRPVAWARDSQERVDALLSAANIGGWQAVEDLIGMVGP